MFRKTSSPIKHQFDRQRGFTIIEVTVVILIIAVIAAFAVPQILTYIKMYKLGIAARNVATALQRARYLATSDNKRVGINIFEIQRIDIEEYDEGAIEPKTRGVVLLPPGIVISEDAPRRIAFDGRGVVTPLPRENPTIRIDGPDGYYAVVTVSATGQITISDAKKQGT